VLAWFAFELGFVGDGPSSTFQKEVCALTARKFGLGAEITCHEKSFVWSSDAATER
jgi:hypothetical protein